MTELNWQALRNYAAQSMPTLGELFSLDPQRATNCSWRVGPLFVDLSKQRVDAKAWKLLQGLAEQAGISEAIQALFSGAIVNPAEQRAALHPLLRAPLAKASEQLGAQALEMAAVRARLQHLVEAVHQGRATEVGLIPPTDIVNIGIGGSDLGPRLVTEALSALHVRQHRVHFVANVDAHALVPLLAKLNPQSTLFIIASKSFSTQETLLNAQVARRWLLAAGIDAAQIGKHFVAVSSNVPAAQAFGLEASHVFPMWDSIGGRYSVWSAVGLSVAFAVGWPAFEELLAGAHALDQHFASAPLTENLPALLGLLGCWNRNVLEYPTHAVVPYDERLGRLSEYLQQLEMESNGKRIGVDGNPLTEQSAAVLWGGIGTNVQHAFFQALHQGTQVVPVDFIGVIKPAHAEPENHNVLLANLFAQSAALLQGKSAAQAYAEGPSTLAPAFRESLSQQRAFPGNRPSTTILLDELTPFALGHLLALYEHKVFVQSRLWGINAFDQWGVELGKVLANALLPALSGAEVPQGLDSSTYALLAEVAKQR